MRRTVFTLAILGFAVSTALGDGIILADGRKLSGRVVEKPDGYEVTVEGQTVGFTKAEVKQWVKLAPCSSAMAVALNGKKIDVAELCTTQADIVRFNREATSAMIPCAVHQSRTSMRAPFAPSSPIRIGSRPAPRSPGHRGWSGRPGRSSVLRGDARHGVAGGAQLVVDLNA